MNDQPVSLIICTYNRADSLAPTLESLKYLAYPSFEVVVVQGPCSDHTSEVLDQYESNIKLVPTAESNVSLARNLGVAAAGGSIVAFLDDDAIPDTSWLDDLVFEFQDPEVAATGGPVFGPTGHELQVRYSLSDRWGDTLTEFDKKRLDHLQQPDSWYFPYTTGTNSLMRRDLLVEIGGFDENYGSHLGEADVCARLLDLGYRVVPQDRGYVWHKSGPTPLHTFEVLLSRLYFSMRNGLRWSDEVQMGAAFAGFVKARETEVTAQVLGGHISPSTLEQFRLDVRQAWRMAPELAARPAPTRLPEWFAGPAGDFRPFQTKTFPSRRLRYGVVTNEYPPGTVHGIGRACHTLAVGLAAAGHAVHVVAGTDAEHSTVDFEDGVWVHRIVSTPHGSPPVDDLPSALWDRSGSVLDELKRIDAVLPLDAVHLPNWDAEGFAVLLSRTFRTVLFAHTPILAVAEHDRRVTLADPAVRALADADRMSYEVADVVMVSFPSTVAQLNRLYGIEIPPWKVAVVPHGLPDHGRPTPTPPSSLVEILFIGRLEPRKGIDTLLAAVPELCTRYPDVRFVLAGDDSIEASPGTTYKQSFQNEQPPTIAGRVEFTGPLTDRDLEVHLSRCRIFVAPSHFESFGLVNLEAMRAGKPVVSTAVNGVASVVRDGEDGILIPPGDVPALIAALSRLIEDQALRTTLGANAQRSFETNFTVERMIDGTVKCVEALIDGRSQPTQPLVDQRPPSGVHPLSEIAAERQQRLLDALHCPSCRGSLTVEPAVTTSDGRVKTGRIWCPSCHEAKAVIRSFQVRFSDVEPIEPTVEATPPPRIVPELGEQRLTGIDDLVTPSGWDRHPDCWTSTRVGSTLTFRGPCTDVRARVVDHENGGVVEVSVDQKVVCTLDTRHSPGSVTRMVDLATDLDLANHEVAFTVVDLQPGAHILIQELLLLGPRGEGLPFLGPAPFKRGNPYSERILDYLNSCRPDQLILECGGGDSRPGRPNQFNLEFLPYEGPDLRADIHRLPFGDDTFDIVLNQAVLEHLAEPRAATDEMIRVCQPGGMILTEVAFMQPLHAVPYHFYNMTQWGTEELFKDSCDILESDWFGNLSFTMDWLLDASGVTAQLDPSERKEWSRRFASLDELIDHGSLRAVASGIWLAARKR
jgi:glycosyltransferase involved in cell wall biosynthesis/GT2 family glycosyltransferase/SAM-dependent methyltransferase